MPRDSVGRFDGYAVHGGGGAYRYDHATKDIVVHVHPHPERKGWQVSIDQNSTGAPGTVLEGVGRHKAFGHAYDWMEGHESGSDGERKIGFLGNSWRNPNCFLKRENSISLRSPANLLRMAYTEPESLVALDSLRSLNPLIEQPDCSIDLFRDTNNMGNMADDRSDFVSFPRNP